MALIMAKFANGYVTDVSTACKIWLRQRFQLFLSLSSVCGV